MANRTIDQSQPSGDDDRRAVTVVRRDPDSGRFISRELVPVLDGHLDPPDPYEDDWALEHSAIETDALLFMAAQHHRTYLALTSCYLLTLGDWADDFAAHPDVIAGLNGNAGGGSG
jgi:hypothetical protein